MRLVLIAVLCTISLSSPGQKRVLKGNQSHWKAVVLPQDHQGYYLFAGEIQAQAKASELYEKALEWVLINQTGPYNKMLAQDFNKKEVIFQRSFNYYFWKDTRTPDFDNRIIVYEVKLSLEDGEVHYQLTNFRHDHSGRLVPMEEYLKLPFVDDKLRDQIKSQVIMNVEGFIWVNGEEKGFLEDVARVMNTEALEN